MQQETQKAFSYQSEYRISKFSFYTLHGIHFETLNTDRKLLGGIRSVMFIVIRNGAGDVSSNPGRDCFHFM